MKRKRLIQKKYKNIIIVNNVLIISLASLSIALLTYELTANVSNETKKIIQDVDVVIALFFLFEFIFNLTIAKNKTRFLKNRWWELFAAIPITTHTTQALRALELVRFIPIIDALRFLRLAVKIKIFFETSKRIQK